MVYWYLIGPTKRFMLAGEGGETEGRRQKTEGRRQKFRSSGAGTSDGDVRVTTKSREAWSLFSAKLVIGIIFRPDGSTRALRDSMFSLKTGF